MPPLTQEQVDNALAQGVSQEQIDSFVNTGQVVVEKPATFPAVIGEVTKEPLRLLGNIPQSAFRFVKGLITGFAKTPGVIAKIPEEFGELAVEAGGVKEATIAAAKEVPISLLEVVPESWRALFKGDTERAEKLIVEDPIGQILPLFIIGRGAAATKGQTAAFDAAISRVARPVTKTGRFAKDTIARTTGKVSAAGLGVTTGVGKLPIQEAFKSGRERGFGIREQTPFSKALRGKTEPTEIIEQATNAINIVKEARAESYLAKFREVAKNKQSLDISPILRIYEKQLVKFNIRVDKQGNIDFSRSTIGKAEAISDIRGVVELMRNWGTQVGDRSAIGLDILKRRLDDFYSPSGQARAFVTSVNNSVKNTLNKNVEGYQVMTKEYRQTSLLLEEMKKGLALGGKAGTDAIMRKLTSALRQDNEFRTILINQLEELSGIEITEAIAGHLLSQLPAKGLIGRSVQVGAAGALLTGFLGPKMIVPLLVTSPRIVGEFIQALGATSAQTQRFFRVLNELRPLFPEIKKLE